VELADVSTLTAENFEE
jgi:uncharacterized protein YgbK (DUF1537 family)